MECNDMDFEFEEEQILFLRGVFVKDLNRRMDDDYYDSLTVDTNTTETITYNKFPRRFYNLETWIKTSNLECVNCSNKILHPIPIPSNMKYSGKQKIFDIERIACSFPCAMKYLNNSMYNNRWERVQALLYLFYIFHGVKVTNIPESKDRLEQIRYGGVISADEFIKTNNEIVEKLIIDAQ